MRPTSRFVGCIAMTGYLLDAATVDALGFGPRPMGLHGRGYVDQLVREGLIPFATMPAPGLSADEICDRVQGVLLTGGEDVHPSAYGQNRTTAEGEFSSERDQFETDLLREALERRLPVLGVCRGMQLMNVVLGGDLIQHLPSERPGLDHGPGRVGPFPYHEVAIDDPVLRELMGARLLTNSNHHQAVGDVAPGFEVVGRTTDGVPEAILDPTRRLLGVQWHPEGLSPNDPPIAGPFKWLASQVAAMQPTLVNDAH